MSEHNTTDNNLKIEFGQVPKVLLLGNGINRAYSFSSWEDLISSIGTINKFKKELKKVAIDI